MNKLLILFTFLLSSCDWNYPDRIKVGMFVTNGYCQGQVIHVFSTEARLLNPSCGPSTYNYLDIKLDQLKEVNENK